MKLNINNSQGCFYAWDTVKQGVPQGSVWSPLLIYCMYK